MEGQDNNSQNGGEIFKLPLTGGKEAEDPH